MKSEKLFHRMTKGSQGQANLPLGKSGTKGEADRRSR